MVLVERNTENMRNGRRSRGPSPNGQGGTPDSSSDDDSTKKTGKSSKAKSEYEEKIRVGRDYQVQCPDFIPQTERKPDALLDRALLVWSPTKDIPECKLEDYISVAKERYGYNGEQALGMLFWHKHDLERAVVDLANFTPFPDEWSGEDKVLFEQAFQFHGKSFHRIRQMLPDKSIASLVKYYYSWKKSRCRTSVMDRVEKLKTKEPSGAAGGGGNGGGAPGSENGSENGSNEESESDEKHHHSQQSGPFVGPASAAAAAAAAARAAKLAMKPEDGARSVLNVATSTCFGCGVSCTITNISPHGALCSSCFHHWRRTGALRPTSGPLQSRRCRSNGMERYKRKPPRGMYINHDDIVALATQDDEAKVANGAGNPYLTSDPLNVLDREITAMLTKIQANKQAIDFLHIPEALADVASLRPSEASTRINPRWNNEEHLLAVEGIRRYGKDFTAIAELIGTKSETHLRTFFVNYRRKYGLDLALKEFDMRQKRKMNVRRQSNADAGGGSECAVEASVNSAGAGAGAGANESDEDVIMESDPGQF